MVKAAFILLKDIGARLLGLRKYSATSSMNLIFNI